MEYRDMRIYSYEHGGVNSEQTRAEYHARYDSPAAWRLPFCVGNMPAFVYMHPAMVSRIASIHQKNYELTKLNARLPRGAFRQFVRNSIVEEIQQSNEMENVHSTRREIWEAYEAMEENRRGKRFEGMVRKYDMLLQNRFGTTLQNCSDVRQLYDEFVCDEVVRENPENAPDGMFFRKGPVHVTSSRGEVIHDGLTPEKSIIEAMEQALLVLNDESQDILLRTAVFHYMFGYIHPFYDGNGRMARFICSSALAREYDLSMCLRISYTIKANRAAYQNAFKNANDYRNMGDLTSFVMEFLHLLDASAEDVSKTLTRSERRYTLYEIKLRRNRHYPSDGSGQKILQYLLEAELFGTPGVPTDRLAAEMKSSVQTLRNRLQRLDALVFCKRVGRKYHWHINLDALENE